MFIGFILFVLTCWLGILSFFIWRQTTGYNKLTSHGKQLEIRQLLESLVASQERLAKQNTEHVQITDILTKQGQGHIQCIGMTRFNPFADTGGAQSFSLAILDAHANGLVMTSLYGRNSNRWYVKEITQGKAKDHDLSREEKDAIRKALDHPTLQV